MKKRLVLTIATVLLWIAQISAASACVGGFYDPDVPEEIR